MGGFSRLKKLLKSKKQKPDHVVTGTSTTVSSVQQFVPQPVPQPAQNAVQPVQQSVQQLVQQAAVPPPALPQSEKRQESFEDVKDKDNDRFENGTAHNPRGAKQNLDYWAEAYRQLEARQPELAADYIKHVETFHNPEGSHKGNFMSSAASAVPVISQLIKDREKRQWRIPLLDKDIKIRSQVEKLTKFFLFTDGIVKQALSCQPYAALAWSGVSLLLPLITSGKVQHDSMLGGFEYIGNLQLYWKSYEEEINSRLAHAQDTPISEALTKLYSHIVEYQARAICHLSSAQLSRTWQKVADSNDWEGKKQTIDKLDQHCKRLVSESDRARMQHERALELRKMQESRDILAEIREGLQESEAHVAMRIRDEKESALLRDLSSEFEHFKNTHPLRVQGTCEWIFNDDDFRKWRASTTSSLLWVSASPGCGKSVLTRCLIDENRLSNSAATSIVCYFFFQTGIEGQMDSASALASVLHQLFVQDSTGEMIQRGLASHKNYGEKLRGNFAEMWRVLLACADFYPSGEIIIVLDALDECGQESRQKFLNALEIFFAVTARNSNLKFLITSRPYDDLEVAFKKHTNRSSYLRVDGDEKAVEIGKEINLVIDNKLEEFAEDFSDHHRKALAEKLKTMENRTYLWLHLTFDIIKQKISFYSKSSQIQALLKSLPGQISDAYETILNHISDDADDRNMTKALLEIVLAATRPLTLEEVNYALTLRVAKDCQFSSHADIDDELWPRERFKTVVKNLSGLFITVCDSRLSFIHLTAREFLTDTKERRDWRGCFTMEKSHNTMSTVCLGYLTVVDPGMLVDGKLESYAGDFPFLPYALMNWPFHYRSQDDDGRQELCGSARMLCSVSNGRGDRLVQMYCETQTLFWTMDEPSQRTELNFACALGLMPVIKQIASELSGGLSYTESYPTALNVAASQGHADVVQFLLKSTDSIEAHTNGDSVALTMALYSFFVGGRRQFEVVKALLDHSPDVHILEEHAFSSAMMTGGRALVSLLVERFENEIQFSDYHLEQAVSNADHGVEVLEWLLDHRPKNVHTSEAILVVAARNARSAAQVFTLLLKRRGDEMEITEEVLVHAAANQACGRDLLAVLFKARGKSIQLTQKVLISAADNHGSAQDIFELLLRCKSEGEEIKITNELVSTMVENRMFGKQLLKLVADHGYVIPITSETFEALGTNAGCGAQIAGAIMDMEGSQGVPITAKAMENAAQNEFAGNEITACLLTKSGSRDVTISAQAVGLAARNDKCGKEILELFIQNRGDELPITVEVIEQAACNRGGQGPQVMSMLLDRGGAQVPISSKAVMNAARNPRNGKALIRLLLETRGDEVDVTNELVAAGARNERDGEAIRCMLLKKREGA